MRKMAWCAGALLLFGVGSARAQVDQYPGTAGTIIPVGDSAWSATAARTVGSGNSVVQVTLGVTNTSKTLEAAP